MIQRPSITSREPYEMSEVNRTTVRWVLRHPHFPRDSGLVVDGGRLAPRDREPISDLLEALVDSGS
jgi:hypothetical protein